MKTWHAIIISIGIVAAGVVALHAAQTSPAQVNGCVYNSGVVTLSTKQSNVFQCDVNGRLLTN